MNSKIIISNILGKNNLTNLITRRNFSYKSDISLDKLYPNANLKFRTITASDFKFSNDKFSGYIPINELQITYSRSSGPGGQNVNCVNTKVDVRFHVESSSWLNEKVKKRLLEEHKNKINKEGYFIIKSDVTRSQQMNLADALEKLREFIRELEKEKPPVTEETLERIRKRQEKAARERLMIKRNRSQTKSDRQSPTILDIK